MGEQPIFTCKAHVFHIDPKTKRSWLPASSAAVNVSFFYDSSRGLYRIISVEATKAVINSTITPIMTFTKTSQKFGQWSDVRANTVYGLGFGSELELNKFIEKFHEVKEATRTATKPSNNTTNTSSISSSSNSNNNNNNNGITPTTNASASSPVAARSSSSSTASKTTTVVGSSGGDYIGVQHNLSNDGGLNTDGGGGGYPISNQNEIGSNNLLKLGAPHARSQSMSGIVQPQQQQQTAQESPKKSLLDNKGGLPASPVPPLTGEAQLKYENDRLKLALAQSSANAKKWEVELSTLKSHNSRLTSALQESTANVEAWQRQLHSYKEENTKLKVGLIELEAGRGNCDFNALSELRNLKERIQELESEIRERDHQEATARTKLSNGEGVDDEENSVVKALHEENETLKKTLDKIKSQLNASLDAQEQQRKVLDAINGQFGEHLHAMGQLQNELSAALNT